MITQNVLIPLPSFALPSDFPWRIGFVSLVDQQLRRLRATGHFVPPRFFGYFFRGATPVGVGGSWTVSLDLGRRAQIVGEAFGSRQRPPHRLPLRVSTLVMTAAVLCIGTELTRGELLNSNAAWLAESLTRIGLEVTAVDCVDDDRDVVARHRPL